MWCVIAIRVLAVVAGMLTEQFMAADEKRNFLENGWVAIGLLMRFFSIQSQ